MKFTIYTFGCKVNSYESNMMKESLLHHNFSYTPFILEADIFIINSCSVTNTADKKCLKLIKRWLKNYPEKISVVVGCSAESNASVYEKLGVDIIIGNAQKNKIADYILTFLKTRKKIKDLNLERINNEVNDIIHSYDHTRAFIKIEDGCDNFCSYCIIPYIRGTVRSKKMELVIEEARELSQNHAEIVLTGIHTGHYQDNGRDLSDLINELSKIDNLKRIRISSIEATELNSKFLDTLKNNIKLVSHLHIPLQSGSDEILKKMNRKYDVSFFTNKIKEIRQIRPDIAISTDIIVGFPGETEENFKETLNLAKKIKFSKIHVFPFSPKNGTAASKMPNQIKDTVKKERVRLLMALSNDLEKEYYNSFKGKTVEVLIEKVDNNKSKGHTDNYLEVTLNEKLEVGKIYKRTL